MASPSDQYFGARRLAVMDQLGSAGTSSSPAPSYFPWGEPRNTNPEDTWSFGTYWTDSVSGLDYAMNRYYSNAYGRFMTPDPYTGSGKPNAPQSWNRYAYVGGDPANKNDPTGLGNIFDDTDSGDGDDGIGSGGGPATYCDPSDASCQNPCYNVDGTPTGSPWCQMPGVPVGVPVPGSQQAGGAGQPFQPGSNQGGSQTCKPGYVYVMGTCLPYPGTIWLKITLPGTNWCGPGGYGPTLNTLDAFCEQHDACYAEADVSPLNNFPRVGGRHTQIAIHGCNVQLCKDVGSILTGPVPTLSSSLSYILLWEDSVTIWDVFNCMSGTMQH